MTVQQWRRKPQPPSKWDTITTARYKPGQPLAELQQVAAMAMHGRAAECWLPKGTHGWGGDKPAGMVLLVAWTRTFENGPPKADYTVVVPGDYLVYSEDYASLTSDSEQDLQHWYELDREVASP